MDHIQVAMLVVQILALTGLVWYTFETHKIRKASQQQVRISQDLIRAAMDQVEGLSKPCLTLWSDLRDAQDAIAELHAVGNLRARLDRGNFALHNIGNGIALNINYRMVRPDRPGQTRYLPNALAGQKITMPEPATAYGDEVEVIFEYQSIGDRHYRSTLRMDHHVLATFQFEEFTIR
jgi:hypothetical protein